MWLQRRGGTTTPQLMVIQSRLSAAVMLCEFLLNSFPRLFLDDIVGIVRLNSTNSVYNIVNRINLRIVETVEVQFIELCLLSCLCQIREKVSFLSSHKLCWRQSPLAAPLVNPHASVIQFCRAELPLPEREHPRLDPLT